MVCTECLFRHIWEVKKIHLYLIWQLSYSPYYIFTCIYLFLKYWILSNIYYHFDLIFQVSKCPVIILKPFIIIANSQAMATWYSLHYVSTLLHSASWGWAGCAWSRPGGLPMLCAHRQTGPWCCAPGKEPGAGGAPRRRIRGFRILSLPAV